MIRSLTTVVVVTVVLSTPAWAIELPDPYLSTVEIDPLAVGASVLVVPDGAGVSFDQARAPGGLVVDATITVTVVNPAGYPLPDWPLEDIWLETSAGGLVACADGTTADAPTDENGQTVWLEPLFAGGCSAGESVVVVVSGYSLIQTVPIHFVSPDINGDLHVHLVDIVAFVQALAEYEPYADFNHDGAVNLADIVLMTQNIGANCQ